MRRNMWYMRPYELQKSIAKKHLERAAQERGTPHYKGAYKRACVEMSHLIYIAKVRSIVH